MKEVMITGILVFGGATIFALAQGMPIEVALTTGGTTLALTAGVAKG